MSLDVINLCCRLHIQMAVHADGLLGRVRSELSENDWWQVDGATVTQLLLSDVSQLHFRSKILEFLIEQDSISTLVTQSFL